MTTTAKDYVAIADILKRMHDRALTHREHTLVCHIAVDMGVYFRKTNLLFDETRFLAATGSLEYSK